MADYVIQLGRERSVEALEMLVRGVNHLFPGSPINDYAIPMRVWHKDGVPGYEKVDAAFPNLKEIEGGSIKYDEVLRRITLEFYGKANASATSNALSWLNVVKKQTGMEAVLFYDDETFPYAYKMESHPSEHPADEIVGIMIRNMYTTLSAIAGAFKAMVPEFTGKVPEPARSDQTKVPAAR